MCSASARLRFVAAMIRTSTEIGLGFPNRSIVWFSSTRKSFTCMSLGSSPISSRKSVEPWASSKRPICFDRAPV